jgi:CBS domain-containing protein
MRVQELLRNKGFQVITVQPETTVTDAVALLKEHNLGAVVVSVDGREVNGILTERDVVRRLVQGTEFLDGPASDIMTADVLTCAAGDSVESVMTTMTQRRIRHLPVVDEHRRLTGIISIGDVVKSHITQVEFERDMLEGYVSG